MKQFLKKFKNFRLTAFIEAILGVVSIIGALLLLILYQTNQTRINGDGTEILIPGFPGQPLSGMVFFLAGIIAIIFSIIAIYASLPFILKKEEKLEPNKLIPYFGVIAAVFSVIEIIFTFLMISLPGSRNTVPLIIFSIILALSSICQLLMLYPAIKVRIKKD